MTTDRPAPAGRSIRAGLGEGLGYARKSPTILGLLFLGTLPGVFFIGPLSVTIVLMVEDVLQASDRFVGILIGCFGAVVLLGSLLMTLRPIPRRGLMLCVSPIWGGAIYALYGLSEMLPLSMALLLLWGLGGALFMNLTVSLIQEACAPEMMGRVMSMHSLAFTISTPAGYLQAGIVASLWGPQAELVASGLVIAVAGLFRVAFLSPVRRLV